MNKRNTATDYMLWAYLETKYAGCSELSASLSPATYILGKPRSDTHFEFKNLQVIAERLTIPQIGKLESLFDGMKGETMSERERKTAAALAGSPSQVASMLTGNDCFTETITSTDRSTAYQHVRKVNPTMPAWAVWAYIWRIIRSGTFSRAFPAS